MLGGLDCNFAGVNSDNVDPRGSIDNQLGKLLWNFAGITSDNVDPWGTGVQLTLNLGSHFATLAGITSDNVDSWGVNRHSTWEVTLQLCWDYL